MTAVARNVNNETLCETCDFYVLRREWRQHLGSDEHRMRLFKPVNERLQVISGGYKNRISTFAYKNTRADIQIPDKFLAEASAELVPVLKSVVMEHLSCKVNFELKAMYKNISLADERTEQTNKAETEITHQTKLCIITVATDIEEVLKEHAANISAKMDDFQYTGSGWSLSKIVRLELNINKYCPLKGAGYIDLPPALKSKKSLINVKNEDEFCFKWALISALKIPKSNNSDRCVSYNVADIESATIEINAKLTLNFERMQFPVELKQITLFEAQNPCISVNVFGYDSNSKCVIGPLYLTKAQREHHISLMYLENDERAHFVWIKNLSGLVRKQLTRNCRKLYLCNTCLNYSQKQSLADSHRCGKVVARLPTPENARLGFQNHKHCLPVPLVVYADIECVLSPVNKRLSANVVATEQHMPIAYSYLIKCETDQSLDKFVIESGHDAGLKFVTSLFEDIEDVHRRYLSKKKPMIISPGEELSFQNAITCHICAKALGTDRVRDHCHITGGYRGAAHNMCNIRYQNSSFVPVYFHNFSGYDAHLFIRELGKISGDIKVIALNKEHYISLSKLITVAGKEKQLEIRFLDTYRFMAESLDNLSANLSVEDFATVQRYFPDSKQWQLMIRKGVFPFDHLDDAERLKETALPAREKFFNRLTNRECSPEDYEHAANVWRSFDCASLQDYMELYLKTDVLLLADVFQNFRKVCQKIYKLDPAHYYTAPGLSWSAMLKTTQIELELFTDIDMNNMIKDGIRGGLVQCCKRHTKANHKDMPDYDKTRPTEHLMYLDANNLYGWAMSQFLPYGEFQWLSDEEINSFDVRSFSETDDYGYILDVDLGYDQALHDHHNDLPFCPSKQRVTPKAGAEKLIADLRPKTNYVIHYRNLQQCLKHGLTLEKTHRILRFRQAPWLKKYIDLNTEQRIKATTNFEKNFFKLLNNAVYGKTIENVEKRVDVKIVTKWESSNCNKLGARALIAKSNFHSLSQFAEDMYAIQMKRLNLVYNKPIYLGFVVLELSKWKMYDFHYDYMKKKFDNKISLNYMDTDSFIYSIQTEDFLQDISEDIEMRFDLSDYPEEQRNKYQITLGNKKKLGMMKDENCGKRMLEFVGLRPKMYALTIDKGGIVQKLNEVKKAKGVKKSTLDKLSLASYKECLFENTKFSDSMLMIRSQGHNVYTQSVEKVTLSRTDDKRHIRDDGINTYAWGHYRIKT